MYSALELSDHINSIRNKIGYVAQQFALYPELTVLENMQFYSGLYNSISKIPVQVLLEKFKLTDYSRQRAGTLSGGFKRRLSIACALAHDPEVIFLDEPTAGIDPVTRKELWEQFYELAANGKTLFITTHYMEEAERCHELAFIHHGKLITDDTPSQIKQQFQKNRVYACEINFNPDLISAIKKLKGVIELNQLGSQLRIIVDKNTDLEELKNCLNQFFAKEIALQEVMPSIEDVFMTLTRDNIS